MDKRIKFYSQNTNFLPPKPKSSFRHLKQGIQEFHRKYVLVSADKAANIANSGSCTTTELSKLLTSCLTAIKAHVIRHCV